MGSTRHTQRFRAVSVLLAALALALAVTQTTGAVSATFSWQLHPTGSTARLRGVSAVSSEVAWVSGSLGTVLRTLDGGNTWQNVSPPGVSDLQFRDIEAFDRDTAVVLAIGPGEASRVYRTEDGGTTWTLAFRNTDPAAFYDCMAFFDLHRGLVLGDPVGGKFQILATVNGGRSWALLPTDGMPAALPGEFAFAASGTCIETAGGRDAWFGTGGDAVARAFHSRDRGLTWVAVDTPVRSGPTAGIFSLAFADPRHGLVVGGDFLTPDQAPDGAALTSDGGTSWTVASGPGEYRSGAAWVPRLPWTAVAVGPTGSHVTTDAGQSWTRFAAGSLDAVDCVATGACWASGAGGQTARLLVTR